MVFDYFIKNIKSPQVYIIGSTKVITGEKKEKLKIFKKKKYWLSLVIINENEITYDIKNICEYLINKFQENDYPNKKISLDVNWYIFSNIVNKNIYEKIDIKDNRKYKNMYNRFVLINNINGEILFNPGKVENNVISDRMKFLYNYYQMEYPMNEEKEKQFSVEMMHVFEILDKVIYNFK
jgi:hypothetical protein